MFYTNTGTYLRVMISVFALSSCFKFIQDTFVSIVSAVFRDCRVQEQRHESIVQSSHESSDHTACVSFLVLYYPEKWFIYSVGPLKPGACCGACGFCDVSKFCYRIEPMIAI